MIGVGEARIHVVGFERGHDAEIENRIVRQSGRGAQNANAAMLAAAIASLGFIPTSPCRIALMHGANRKRNAPRPALQFIGAPPSALRLATYASSASAIPGSIGGS